MLRLVAKADDPSIEIGWLNANDRARAQAAGEEIARVSGLPLIVEDEGKVIQSPFEEDMERESEEDSAL